MRRVLLGNIDVPQQCTVAMSDPQSEVEVWLHGLGPELNVTDRHAIACAAPSMIAMRLGGARQIQKGKRLSLKFRHRHGDRALLGELRLRSTDVVGTSGGDLHLFEVRGSESYCQPKLRMLGFSLFQAWLRARQGDRMNVEMTARAEKAMTVLFSCPRPVVLVSLVLGESGNMFPMNLMGPLGHGYFGFALKTRARAAALVESAGRVALSSIPFDQAGLARQLGKNHRRDTVHWSELPFPTARSGSLDIPVPAFASRVRELEIETIRKLGSHTLFIARILRDERWSDSPQFFMIHGLFQVWRQSRTSAATSIQR